MLEISFNQSEILKNIIWKKAKFVSLQMFFSDF